MPLKPIYSKFLKGFHITFAAILIGGFVGILLLTVVKSSLVDKGGVFPIDLSILKMFTLIITYSSFCLIITSCLYSIFFGWGIIRFYWVAIKWVGVALLFLLMWFGLGPAIGGMASISDSGFHISTMNSRYNSFTNFTLLYSSIGLGIMIIIIFISVLKPFGARKEKESKIEKVISSVILTLVIGGILAIVISEQSIKKYRTMPIKDADLSILENGIYYGEAEIGGFIYKVEVTIAEHKIVTIKSINKRKSPYVDYAEGVFSKIIRDQNANTDAITGATTTSKAYMKAVEQALSGEGTKPHLTIDSHRHN